MPSPPSRRRAPLPSSAVAPPRRGSRGAPAGGGRKGRGSLRRGAAFAAVAFIALSSLSRTAEAAVGPDGTCNILSLLPFSVRQLNEPERNRSDPINDKYRPWSNGTLEKMGLDTTAAALLAIQHFNAKAGAVVKNLKNLTDGCNVTLSLSVKDSQWDDGDHSVRQVIEAVGEGGRRQQPSNRPAATNRRGTRRDLAQTSSGGGGGSSAAVPCVVLGPIHEKAAMAVSTTTSALGVPQVVFHTSGNKLLAVESPTTVGVSLSLSGKAGAMVQYLQMDMQPPRDYLVVITDPGPRTSDLADAMERLGQAAGLTVLNFDLERPPSVYEMSSSTISVPEAMRQGREKLLEAVQQTGITTVMLSVEDDSTVSSMATLLESKNMFQSEYLYILLSEAFPTDHLTKVVGEQAQGSPLDSLLSGAILFDQLDGFRNSTAEDPFLAAWKSVGPDFVAELNALIPNTTNFRAGNSYFRKHLPSAYASFVYDAVMTIGLGGCHQERPLGGMESPPQDDGNLGGQADNNQSNLPPNNVTMPGNLPPNNNFTMPPPTGNSSMPPGNFTMPPPGNSSMPPPGNFTMPPGNFSMPPSLPGNFTNGQGQPGGGSFGGIPDGSQQPPSDGSGGQTGQNPPPTDGSSGGGGTGGSQNGQQPPANGGTGGGSGGNGQTGPQPPPTSGGTSGSGGQTGQPPTPSSSGGGGGGQGTPQPPSQQPPPTGSPGGGGGQGIPLPPTQLPAPTDGSNGAMTQRPSSATGGQSPPNPSPSGSAGPFPPPPAPTEGPTASIGEETEYPTYAGSPPPSRPPSLGGNGTGGGPGGNGGGPPPNRRLQSMTVANDGLGSEIQEGPGRGGKNRLIGLDPLLLAMTAVRFHGASGLVHFAGGAKVRDPTGTLAGLFNVQRHANLTRRLQATPNGSTMDTFKAELVSVWVDGAEWQRRNGTTIMYRDGSTVAPALTRNVANQNYLSTPVRAVGLTLLAVAWALGFGSIAAVHILRKDSIVQRSQPFFLQLLCLGSVIMSSSILTLSFDEGLGTSQTGLDVACMATQWFFFIGQMMVFSALFTKLWRLDKVLQFRRGTKVTILNVIAPLVVLLVMTVVILTVWSAVDPWSWNRVIISLSPAESYGQCGCSNFWAYFGPLMALVVAAEIVTGFFAWKTSDVPEDFRDSSAVFYSILTQLQAWLVGVPILAVLGTSSVDATYFGRVLLIWIFAVSSIGIVVAPRVVRAIHIRRHPELANRGSRVKVSGVFAPSSLPTTSQSGSVSFPNEGRNSLPPEQAPPVV